MLFSRVPDYFEADFTTGIVLKAIFSVKEKHPVLVVNYNVGNDKFTYTTNAWFLTSHKEGQVIPIIYNSSNPAVCSVYGIIGYWIKWDELLITAIVFVILFIAAIIITGKNNTVSSAVEQQNKKRKYDDNE